MNPYRNLMSNTVLFGISTFGARFLTFLLTPFYTRVLTSAEYGVTDLLLQTGNLIIPIASVGIANAVIRYGLERSGDKNGVFTIGVLTTLAGFCLLLLASPLLGQIAFLSGYLWLVLLYVLAANVHSVCSQFARTLGHVRLFALDGVLRTVLTIFFNILLLAVIPMGVTGYVLANVLADGLTTAFVFLRAREWRYLSVSAVSRRDAARMLRYSIPLVPTNLCGWIINISDRYLIALLIGSAATGIYAVSNKIPTVLLTVANTFSSAWQLSTRLLAAPEYFEAWRYVPVLTLATTFACLGSFLASIYMVEQRSGATLATTLLGAACNLAGNALLIPLLGSMGAALSTLLSYIVIWCVRAVHTRALIRISLGIPRLLASTALLAAQCVLIEKGVTSWYLWSGICLLAVCAVNRRPLLGTLNHVFRVQR